MKTKAIKSFAGSQSYEPRTIGDIIEKMLQSNSPMSRGYRTWQRAQFPTTEPCVDLKLITILPGGLPEGEYLSGVITRDGDDHFSFIKMPWRRRWQRLSNETLTCTRVRTSISIANPMARSTLPLTALNSLRPTTSNTSA